MSWRERQQWGVTFEERAQYKRASFNGIEFWVDMYELSAGRRLSVQRFPGKRYTNVQDLGRESDKLSITAVFLGHEYDTDRDNLEGELLAGGAGILSLPWRDPYEATVVGNVVTQESRTHRGYCTMKFTLIETKPRPEFTRIDPQSNVRVAGVNARAVVQDRFMEKFDAIGMNSERVFSVRAMVTDAIGKMDQVQQSLNAKIRLISVNANAVSNLFGSVNSLINTPLDLSDAIIDAVTTIYSSVKSSVALAENVVRTWGRGGPVRYLADVTFGFGNDFTPVVVSTRTSDGRQEQTNLDAFYRFMMLQMLIELLLSLTTVEFESFSQAVDFRNQFSDALEEFLVDADDIEYTVLADMKESLNNYVAEVADRLPRMGEYTPAVDLHVLPLTHLIYGSAEKNLDIAERNDIRDPGWVQGGVTLEVIRDDGL